MYPFLSPPAVERTDLPERIVFFGGRHCSNKVVSAPGNWRPDYRCIIGKASKKERVFYSHADRKGRSPPLTVIFWWNFWFAIFTKITILFHLIRSVGKPLLPGNFSQKYESCCINCKNMFLPNKETNIMFDHRILRPWPHKLLQQLLIAVTPGENHHMVNTQTWTAVERRERLVWFKEKQNVIEIKLFIDRWGSPGKSLVPV